MTFSQIQGSILVQGASSTWDVKWRSSLVENLKILVSHLWKQDIHEIYVNGSFVEDKDHPNDIDGYFNCDINTFSLLQSNLQKMDPCWTWDPSQRVRIQGSSKAQLPMWHKYHVELYPHFAGLMSGIRDEFGNDQPFPAAFRKTRGNPRIRKGIVKIIK